MLPPPLIRIMVINLFSNRELSKSLSKSHYNNKIFIHLTNNKLCNNKHKWRRKMRELQQLLHLTGVYMVTNKSHHQASIIIHQNKVVSIKCKIIKALRYKMPTGLQIKVNQVHNQDRIFRDSSNQVSNHLRQQYKVNKSKTWFVM